jgi:hypothetical protein
MTDVKIIARTTKAEAKLQAQADKRQRRKEAEAPEVIFK